MTEGQPKGIPPQEGKSRKLTNWEKIQRSFDLVRRVMDITPETDIDDAIERITLVEKSLLRKKEDREIKLLRNRGLRNAGYKPQEWHLYDLNYVLKPSRDGIIKDEFSDVDIESLYNKLPAGIDIFAQKGIYIKSDPDYARSGERIGTSHQYWEIYVRKTPQNSVI